MIALSDWVLWATHYAQSPIQSLIHPLIQPVTPSPTPSRSPSPSSGGSGGGSSDTAAIVVAVIALVGSVTASVVALVVGLRSSGAANRSATAAGESATAAKQAAGVAEASRVDLEARSKREELMRSLRWASELAVAPDQGKARLGVAQLRALGQSSFLDPSGQPLIDAALAALVAAPARELDKVGGDAEVVAIVPPGTLLPRPGHVRSVEAPPSDEDAE